MRARGLMVIWGCAAALAPVPAAAAEQPNYVNLRLGTSVRYDSNVFRLPSGAAPPAGLGTTRRSDVVTSSTAGLTVDVPWSLQRFQVDVAQTAHRFDRFSFLDFDAFEYRAAWLWQVTPDMRGTLRADRRVTLVPLEDATAFQRGLRIVENRVFTSQARLFGGWHLTLGAAEYRQSDTQRQLVPEQGFRATTVEGGVRYVARSGSSVALIQRGSKGTYEARQLDPVNLIDTGFREDQSEVSVDWRATSNTTVRTRLTWVDRRHDNFPQRDFDGLAGEGAFLWSATDKLQLNARATRDFLAWWESAASYRINNAVRIGAAWQVRPRTAIVAELARVQHEYRGPIVPTPAAFRKDTEQIAGVAVNWTPSRFVVIRSGFRHRSRDSNRPARDFDSNVAEISLSLLL